MMRRMIIALVVFATIVAFTAGCQNKSKTVEESVSNSTKEPEQTSIEPTTIGLTTLEPTTISPQISNLRSGYWCNYNGGSSMTAYTFSDEDLKNGQFVGHFLVYDVKNNTVSLMDAQDNNRIINYKITDDAVLVTGEGGLVQTMRFAEKNSVLIENSGNKELRYVHFDSVPNYNDLQKIAPAQKSTEPPKQSKNNIESGMWIKYSPQAAIFETYEFSDGIIERKEYSYESGSITEFNSDYTYAFMTYKIDGDSVTIRDDKSKEWTYNLSEDKTLMERTYQDTMGTDTFTVTERMYHHDSFPSYETVIEQSKKRG